MKNSNGPSDKQNKKRGGFVPKKRRGGKGSDDESVDSKGNLKGFIDYDATSDEEMSSEITRSSDDKPKSPIARRTRNAMRKKKVVESDSESSDASSSSEEERVRENNLVRKLRDEKRRLKQRRREKEEDEELSELERELEQKQSRRRRRLRRVETPESSEDETEEEDEDDDEEYEEDEEDEEDGTVETDDEDDDDERYGKHATMVFSFGGGDDETDRLVPKRHNMKKESAEVKKFVKLITTPSDEDTIDGQIDQFKALTEEQQTKLLKTLESRVKSPTPNQGLMFKILTMNLPTETQGLVLTKYNSLQSLDPGSSEYFKLRNWLEKLTSMPLGIYKELPVKITDGSDTCAGFMERARKSLDEAIYGQDEAKLQILQFIATKIANPEGRGLSLLLAGPPGIGKTSLIKNGVAKALHWPFQFISLGGDSDASTYTGHQPVYEGSHCGKIVNSLCAAKSMSMVLMFDEVDKISTTPKGEEVQNLLVHLTDPVQNGEFEDKYLTGIPIDLSRVMFTFSANYLEKIDKVLLDRMIVVNLQGYQLKDKVAIAEHYLLPAALKEVGLAEKVGISKEILTHIVEEYASEEVGVRELKRCIDQIAQKVNMLRMFNSKELPFYIKDFSLPYVMKKDHVGLFLKKKKDVNESIRHLYT
jgi:hypothetical protein